MNKVLERLLFATCGVLLLMGLNKAVGAQDVPPALNVNIFGLTTPSDRPPLFGPVLTVTGGGEERMHIDTLGSVVFQHGAGVQFSDTTQHAGHIRTFVYIRLANGDTALLPVYAIPGDHTDYGVTIEP